MTSDNNGDAGCTDMSLNSVHLEQLPVYEAHDSALGSDSGLMSSETRQNSMTHDANLRSARPSTPSQTPQDLRRLDSAVPQQGPPMEPPPTYEEAQQSNLRLTHERP